MKKKSFKKKKKFNNPLYQISYNSKIYIGIFLLGMVWVDIIVIGNCLDGKIFWGCGSHENIYDIESTTHFTNKDVIYLIYEYEFLYRNDSKTFLIDNVSVIDEDFLRY